MSKVTDIKTKQELCEFCGEAAHKKPLMCPRITKVHYRDDEITVYFTDTPVVMHFNGAKLDA